MTVGRRDDVEAEGSLHSKRMENKDGRGSSFRDSKSSPGGLALFRLSLPLSSSLFLSRSLSLPLSPSRPWSVSSSGPTYRSASCEVRPSHYIPLGRLGGVYTVEASSVTARSVRRGRVREGRREGGGVYETLGVRRGRRRDSPLFHPPFASSSSSPFSLDVVLKHRKKRSGKGREGGREVRTIGMKRDGK